MRRRAFAALILALPPAVATAQDGALSLARRYVARHRSTLPDLERLALGAVGGGDDPEGLRLEAALRQELATAEPAYAEAMAGILARLGSPALERALADGSIRAAIAASPQSRAIGGALNRLTVESVAALGERTLSRSCASPPCPAR